MAKVLSDVKKENVRPVNAYLGRQLLDIITSGMYNNSLMVIREYVQNAVDSIDEAIGKKVLHLNEGEISVQVSGKNRSVTIMDNGTGISNNEVEVKLGSIGCSGKENSNQRGFRGIGRLGGLAYCDVLKFETRQEKDKFVAVLEWDSSKLTDLSRLPGKKYDLSEAIKNIASIRYRKATTDEPKRFFRVEMVNVRHFHKNNLIDIQAIRTYLSQVAPVPYYKNFEYADKINEFFAKAKIANITRAYSIFVNGEKIYKPYKNEIIINENSIDAIKDIKLLKFTNDQEVVMGVGWYAITSFSSSLPKTVTMRGIRVRHGNIEVGDDRFLDDIYIEKRFSTWHIGEIHLNQTITPNARRDGFEENNAYEKFLEQANMLGRKLSCLCRQSSVERCKKRKAILAISQVRTRLNSLNFFIDKSHFIEVVSDVDKQLKHIVNNVGYNANKYHSEYELLSKNLNSIKKNPVMLSKCIDGRTLTRSSRKELLQDFCSKIINSYKQDESIEEILRKALEGYFKK